MRSWFLSFGGLARSSGLDAYVLAPLPGWAWIANKRFGQMGSLLAKDSPLAKPKDIQFQSGE